MAEAATGSSTADRPARFRHPCGPASGGAGSDANFVFRQRSVETGHIRNRRTNKATGIQQGGNDAFFIDTGHGIGEPGGDIEEEL